MVAMYDRILVPTDGSVEGERAIMHALDLAEIHGATIEAIYVVNAASYGGLPMETAWDGISLALREEGVAALDRVEELTAQRSPSVAVETHVGEGSPSRVIVERARRGDYDLIVMGTHGRGGIDRLLLGSVAERVVRRSPIPVLTVRVEKARDADGPAERTASGSGDTEYTDETEVEATDIASQATDADTAASDVEVSADDSDAQQPLE